MEFVGPLQGAAKAWMGDPQSYERILAAFYRGLFDAGLSVDVVAPAQLPAVEAMVERWPVLVVPGLYVASDALLERLRRYAEAGGHLVLTPRTGYADEDAVARHVVMPGVLREAAGVSYLEYANLTEPVPVNANARRSGDRLGRRAGVRGRGRARPLRAPASRRVPGGDHPRSRRRARHLRGHAARPGAVAGAGRVAGGDVAAGGPVALSIGGALHHSRRRRPRTALRPQLELGAGGARAAGPRARPAVGDAVDVLQLGPWDVRVLVEDP